MAGRTNSAEFSRLDEEQTPVTVDYVTRRGLPPRAPSLSHAGDPGWGPEVEITGAWVDDGAGGLASTELTTAEEEWFARLIAESGGGWDD